MKSWRDAVVSPETTIHETIKRIDETAAQIALVVDDEYKLLGTVTDGDIRRGILRGLAMSQPTSSVMNPKPISVGPDDERPAIFALMKKRLLRRVPIIDQGGKLIGLESIDDLLVLEGRENPVVIMAGGMGTRMQHLTEQCPKPMLQVGGRPILETILMNLIQYGFKNFHFSVHYKADVIADHFGDGSRWNVNIQYLQEKERLGTAGALSLLPIAPQLPILVMNGDLLTKVNFDHLLNFHRSNHSIATMCVREYDFQVPYGVLKLEGHSIAGIEEKPVQKFFVNAGIYVLEPAALEHIPREQYFDMPCLFEILSKGVQKPCAFPVREYWLDVGHPGDYEKANFEFKGEKR